MKEERGERGNRKMIHITHARTSVTWSKANKKKNGESLVRQWTVTSEFENLIYRQRLVVQSN